MKKLVIERDEKTGFWVVAIDGADPIMKSMTLWKLIKNLVNWARSQPQLEKDEVYEQE